MSLVTIPVRIEHGRVIPKDGETLPEEAEGLLTIVPDHHSLPEKYEGETAPSPMTNEEADEFLRTWAGKFELRTEDVENDPKLAYLLKKYGR
jgi:hypothetical protein